MRVTSEYHFDRIVKVLYIRPNGERVEDYADGTVAVSLVETAAELDKAREIAERDEGV